MVPNVQQSVNISFLFFEKLPWVSVLAIPRAKKIGPTTENTRRKSTSLATQKLIRSGNVLRALFSVPKARVNILQTHKKNAEIRLYGQYFNTKCFFFSFFFWMMMLVGEHVRTREEGAEATDRDKTVGIEEAFEVGLAVEFYQFL